MKAVTGHDTLSGAEIRQILAAEHVVRTYQEREAAKGKTGGWAAWVEDNPDKAAFLAHAAGGE